MKNLLIDTGALIGLALEDDDHHAAAVDYLRRGRAATRYVLTDLIVAEVVTLVRGRRNAHLAARWADALLDSERYEVVFADRDLLRASARRMEKFWEHRLSLTDALSMEVIARRRLPAAFAFDRHFRDCGVPMVP